MAVSAEQQTTGQVSEQNVGKDISGQAPEQASGKKITGFRWKAVLFIGLLVVIDQLTKYAAVAQLKGRPSFVLIPGVLELMYLENHGAAFSMLQNQQWFFYILTTVFLASSVWFLRKIQKTDDSCRSC